MKIIQQMLLLVLGVMGVFAVNLYAAEPGKPFAVIELFTSES